MTRFLIASRFVIVVVLALSTPLAGVCSPFLMGSGCAVETIASSHNGMPNSHCCCGCGCCDGKCCGGACCCCRQPAKPTAPSSLPRESSSERNPVALIPADLATAQCQAKFSAWTSISGWLNSVVASDLSSLQLQHIRIQT